MKNILFLFCLVISGFSFAQTDHSEPAYTIAERMPSFPNGDKELSLFIKENLKYPEIKKSDRVTCTAYVTFVVEKDGSLTNIKILRGAQGGPAYDAEACRVFTIMPKWNPGKQNGNLVRVQYNYPIKFSY
jgi:protein TonB